MAELRFQSKFKDKMKLYGKDWSVPNPKAVILLIPGFGDHCERYKYLRVFFNEHNVAVVGIDLRGQGRSGGERGYTPSIDAYLDDLTSGIEIARERYSDVPLFLHGDGIGASLGCLYTIQRYAEPLPDALILCTPSIAFPQSPNSFHLALVRAFSFLAPHFRAPVLGGDYEYTNNPEAIDSRKSDKYFHDRWPAHTAAILVDAGLYFEKGHFDFPIPTLIQHGSKAFLPMEKVREWVKRTKPKEKITFKEWEGFYAELHNDLGRNKLFEYTLSWMEKQLPKINNKSS